MISDVLVYIPRSTTTTITTVIIIIKIIGKASITSDKNIGTEGYIKIVYTIMI